MRDTLFDVGVVKVSPRKWVLINEGQSTNPPPEASLQSRRLFKWLDWSRRSADGCIRAHYDNTWWCALSSQGWYLAFESTHHYKSDSFRGFKRSSRFLLSGACYGLDTNQVVAAPWWAFVISCHDRIQMAPGLYSVTSVTGLWGTPWWRAAVRCHSIPSQPPERLHILATSAARDT